MVSPLEKVYDFLYEEEYNAAITFAMKQEDEFIKEEVLALISVFFIEDGDHERAWAVAQLTRDPGNRNSLYYHICSWLCEHGMISTSLDYLRRIDPAFCSHDMVLEEIVGCLVSDLDFAAAIEIALDCYYFDERIRLLITIALHYLWYSDFISASKCLAYVAAERGQFNGDRTDLTLTLKQAISIASVIQGRPKPWEALSAAAMVCYAFRDSRNANIALRLKGLGVQMRLDYHW